MKNLKAKLNKQGGFTLIEMLIVVAIIAILVAVSIPLVNSSLERAREATDAANERSFKAVLTVSFLNGKYEVEGNAPVVFNPGTIYAFDAAKGTLVRSTATVTGYGKSTRVTGVDNRDRRGQVLYGVIGTNGAVTMGWANTAPASADDINPRTLISPLMVAEG